MAFAHPDLLDITGCTDRLTREELMDSREECDQSAQLWGYNHGIFRPCPVQNDIPESCFSHSSCTGLAIQYCCFGVPGTDGIV